MSVVQCNPIPIFRPTLFGEGGWGEIRKSIVNEDENGLLSLSSSGAHAKGGSSKWCLMIQNSKVAQVKDQHEENTHQVSLSLSPLLKPKPSS